MASKPTDGQASGDTTSSVARAYDHIRRAIISGQYPPNSPLRLQRIANEADVSMIPVREALRTLEAERLVRTVPNRGAIVAGLSLDDVRDAYEIRILLETEALRRSYAHLTEEDLAEARLHAEQQRSLRGHRNDEAADAHRRLHFVLYRKCKSPWLLRFIENLWDHTERYRRIAQPTRGVPAKIVGEHVAVLEAIEQGNVDHAVAALRAHLMNTVQALETSEHAGSEPGAAPPVSAT